MNGKKRPATCQGKKRPPGVSCHEPEGDDQKLRHDADTYARCSALLFRIAAGPRGKFRYVSVNRAFLEATGFTNRQIVGRLVDEVLAPSTAALTLRHCRQAVRMM